MLSMIKLTESDKEGVKKMYNPVILISTGRIPGARSVRRQQSELYGQCLAAAGGLGVLYSSGDPNAAAARCDGLLLSGGGDLHPSRLSSAAAENQCRSVDPVRDAEEAALFEAFYRRGKPIFGICRGMQAINIFMGGSLRTHIEGHSDCCHTLRFPIPSAMPLHIARAVNSYHHQAVDRVASSLCAAACAPDGVIEAIFHPRVPILGVQWHPERMVPPFCEDVSGENHTPLFSWLCEHC